MAVAASTCMLRQTHAQSNPVLPGGALNSNASTGGRTLGGSLNAGPRSLFGNSSAQNNTAAKSGAAATPALTGNEWLIQRAHGKGSFVGADSSDVADFVGAQQTDGTGGPKTALGAAVTTLGNRLGNGLNPPLPSRKPTDLYYPRLTLGFDYAAPAPSKISSTLAQQLKEIPSLDVKSPIEVSVEGTTATLRGVVASERDRALIEQIALFEPGISSVRNLLTLKGPASPSSKPQEKPTAEPKPAK